MPPLFLLKTPVRSGKSSQLNLKAFSTCGSRNLTASFLIISLSSNNREAGSAAKVQNDSLKSGKGSHFIRNISSLSIIQSMTIIANYACRPLY